MLNVLLFSIYVVVIVTCFMLMRVSRDRPSVQLLCMPSVQFALYSAARRAWPPITGGDNAIFLQDKPLVAFWLLLLVWPAWALLIAVRTRRGQGFMGFDGQRWSTLRAQTPTGPVNVARPLRLVEYHERHRSAGD